MSKIIILIAFILLSGCNSCHDKHGKHVIDAEGKIYRLDYRVGYLYYLEEIDTTEINKILKP
jgi:hypothetical protein